MSLYRAFALIVAYGLMLPAGLYRTADVYKWTAIGIITVFAFYKIAHPLGLINRRLPTSIEFGIDLLTCTALPVFTGGFNSPFLVYAFSPVLSAALFSRMGISFIIAPLPFVSALAGHILQHGTLLSGDFTGSGVSQFILISYPVMSFILAAMPHFTNINMYHRVKAQAIAEERGRLSRDMHDGLAQSLSVARWRCEMLWRDLSKIKIQPDTLEHLRFVMKTLDGAQKEAREVIDQLYRTSENRQGLIPSLAQQATDYTRQYGIQCQLHVSDGHVKLTEEAEMQLLCVAQEALNNIRKHAGATSVQVSLVSSKGRLVMTIADDGCGFNPQDAVQGHGLRVMGERVRSIGGHMTVNTNPGQGTSIAVELDRPGGTREELS